MCYLLPLIVISICYCLIWRRVSRRQLPGETQDHGVEQMIHRSKVKVIKMLLVVVILFALSWLPLYVLFTILKFRETTEDEYSVIGAVLPVAQWLGASNSCINPILYAFFNKKFRAGFKAILTSRSCCGTLRYDLGHKNQSTIYSSRSRSQGSNKSSLLSNVSFHVTASRSVSFAGKARPGTISHDYRLNATIRGYPRNIISNGTTTYLTNGNITPV